MIERSFLKCMKSSHSRSGMPSGVCTIPGLKGICQTLSSSIAISRFSSWEVASQPFISSSHTRSPRACRSAKKPKGSSSLVARSEPSPSVDGLFSVVELMRDLLSVHSPLGRCPVRCAKGLLVDLAQPGHRQRVDELHLFRRVDGALPILHQCAQ